MIEFNTEHEGCILEDKEDDEEKDKDKGGG